MYAMLVCHVPLDEIKVDKTLVLFEEHVRNSYREVIRVKIYANPFVAAKLVSSKYLVKGTVHVNGGVLVGNLENANILINEHRFVLLFEKPFVESLKLSKFNDDWIEGTSVPLLCDRYVWYSIPILRNECYVFFRKEQKQKSSKRQRMEDDKEIDGHEEAEEDDKAKMKKHMEVVQDDEEIAIDAIPLAIKPPITVEYKIVKEGHKGFYHLIRADGSSNRYSSMIRMLQNISREDLETLWKLVKTKHGNTRPNDVYEKVFWGDLKVITAGTKVNAAGLQLLEELLLSEG
ncbi:hypothetical protein Tco_0442015 [Tanacetum coccineum]